MEVYSSENENFDFSEFLNKGGEDLKSEKEQIS
jgi:hypothetical protein